jgi:hypothetical protein
MIDLSTFLHNLRKLHIYGDSIANIFTVQLTVSLMFAQIKILDVLNVEALWLVIILSTIFHFWFAKKIGNKVNAIKEKAKANKNIKEYSISKTIGFFTLYSFIYYTPLISFLLYLYLSSQPTV